MKTSAMNGISCRLQASPLGRQMKRHRFWIGLAAGAAVVWASSGGLGALAATGIGAVLLSVLPCALMMGVCMKMMHHGSGNSCDVADKAVEPPSTPTLPALVDNPAASPALEATYGRTIPSGRQATTQTAVPSTNHQG